MHRERTKPELQADAGWALVKRIEATPEHQLALDQYRDGCVALMPFAPDEKTGGAAAAQEPCPVRLPRVIPPPRRESPVAAEPLPDDVLDVIEAFGTSTCRSGGRHAFNLKDAERRCKWCGRTFFELKGREPELMR